MMSAVGAASVPDTTAALVLGGARAPAGVAGLFDIRETNLRKPAVHFLLRRINDASDVVDGARSQQRIAGKVIVAKNHIREPSRCKLPQSVWISPRTCSRSTA
jgi:hypothetical protein